MEKIWICVYRDTIEEHDADENLTGVLVTKEFAEKYVKERFAEDELTLEEFLDEYTADWTEDFYEYAVKHKAVIEIEHLYWEDIKQNLLNDYYV